ncbi:MAG: phosphopentomutase, partial [Mitsuokella sp.]|nr:phosphopentomutase [Mitsuokella sp.]
MKAFKRAFIIVLDSFGIGREPDAPDFGDDVCNTLKTIAASPKYDTPNMKKIGLFNIDGVGCGTP